MLFLICLPSLYDCWWPWSGLLGWNGWSQQQKWLLLVLQPSQKMKGTCPSLLSSPFVFLWSSCWGKQSLQYWCLCTSSWQLLWLLTKPPQDCFHLQPDTVGQDEDGDWPHKASPNPWPQPLLLTQCSTLYDDWHHAFGQQHIGPSHFPLAWWHGCWSRQWQVHVGLGHF